MREPTELARAERLLAIDLQQLREPQDSVERCAQLVAHRRQELALGRARRLGLQPRRPQLVLADGFGRDVHVERDRAALGGAVLVQPEDLARRGAYLDRSRWRLVILRQLRAQPLDRVTGEHAGADARI